ncbi:glycoside hydrolase family 76 protein [Saccharopolyspora shandongensis]|uniref:glycoside hydrolase family 76 protein n=1 Tax=Saccharopolyspora shandongensis TaxID=418495 RepID=UPI00340D1B20
MPDIETTVRGGGEHLNTIMRPRRTGYLPGSRQPIGFSSKSPPSYFAATTWLINSGGLINDGLTDQCANDGKPTHTYNQGVILGALAELHRAAGDEGLLTAARELADSSTTSAELNPDGILRDPHEGGGCDSDGASFKGAYVRGLGALDEQLADHPYESYLDRQADSAYGKDRNALDMYGPHGNGWTDFGGGHGCQHSALDLLNAASPR